MRTVTRAWLKSESNRRSLVMLGIIILVLLLDRESLFCAGGPFLLDRGLGLEGENSTLRDDLIYPDVSNGITFWNGNLRSDGRRYGYELWNNL